MIKRVSCVLKIFDSSTNYPLKRSQVCISVDGCAAEVIYKEGGYFVLADLAEGEHKIEITSTVFQNESLLINVDYSVNFNELMDVLTVMLNPSERHPQALRGCVLKGTFSKAECISFYVASSSVGLKLAEDNADKGKQTVKLFSGGARVMLPSLFHINDKTEKNCEFVMINSARGDEHILGKPLQFAHKRSTEFIPMVQYHSAEDGSFFAVLPAGSYSSGEVTMLIESKNKLISKTITVNKTGINNIDIVKI